MSLQNNKTEDTGPASYRDIIPVEDNEDNFEFYMYVSAYKQGENDLHNGILYLDGPTRYAEDVFKSYPDVTEKIASTSGFVTACLNVKSGHAGRHVAYLGFSSNLVVEIQYADQGFDNVVDIRLLQSDPDRENWHGGVVSLAYVGGFLFAGMGNHLIRTKDTFEWGKFLSTLWDMSPEFEWTHKEDSNGGGVFIYDFDGGEWLHGLYPARDKSAINAMWAFTANGVPRVLTMASEGELPQTVSEGFAIYTGTVGDAPYAYAWPTSSKVTVSRLTYFNDRMQLMHFDPHAEADPWTNDHLFAPDLSAELQQIVFGESDERILYARFSDGNIKVMNLNNFKGDNWGWSNLASLGRNKVSTMLLNPYGERTQLLVGMSDGTINAIDTEADKLKRLGQLGSKIQFMQNTAVGSDYFTVFVCRDNAIYIQKNEEEPVHLTSPGSKWHSLAQGHYGSRKKKNLSRKVDSTALSNLLVSADGTIRFFVGYSTADYQYCTVRTDRSDLASQFHGRFMQSYIQGWQERNLEAQPNDWIQTRQYGTFSFEADYGDANYDQVLTEYPASINVRFSNGNIVLLAQVSRVRYKIWYGGVNEQVVTQGYSSYTTTFDADMSDDQLRSEVVWNQFARNVLLS